MMMAKFIATLLRITWSLIYGIPIREIWHGIANDQPTSIRDEWLQLMAILRIRKRRKNMVDLEIRLLSRWADEMEKAEIEWKRNNEESKRNNEESKQ